MCKPQQYNCRKSTVQDFTNFKRTFFILSRGFAFTVTKQNTLPYNIYCFTLFYFMLYYFIGRVRATFGVVANEYHASRLRKFSRRAERESPTNAAVCAVRQYTTPVSSIGLLLGRRPAAKRPQHGSAGRHIVNDKLSNVGDFHASPSTGLSLHWSTRTRLRS